MVTLLQYICIHVGVKGVNGQNSTPSDSSIKNKIWHKVNDLRIPYKKKLTVVLFGPLKVSLEYNIRYTKHLA